MTVPLVAAFDPGYANLGWAIVCGREALHWGVLRTPAKMPIDERLDAVADEVWRVLHIASPACVGIEEQWRAQVGRMAKGGTTHRALWQQQAVGIIRALARVAGLPVFWITPARVKSAVGCRASADKRIILRAVQMTCTSAAGLPKLQKDEHAADAIAVGVAAGMVARVNRRIG